MKYFILAGEKSGDLHGSNLVRAIFRNDPEAQIMAWGGDEMKREGASILLNYQELSLMGILGVLKNLVRIKRFFQLFKSQILDFQPDTVIFIDYGGFNLRAAKIAKLLGFHTQFYIAPKVWAWNYKRVHKIRKWIDELYVIFPFEKSLFENEKISTTYVGNPIMDEISSFQIDTNFISNNQITSPYIALLPGSRRQEINELLPFFKKLVSQFPSYHFVIAAVEDFKEDFENSGIKTLYQSTYQVVAHSKMAIVCSGTATLETALLNIPIVVVYKTDSLFYFLAKLFVKVKYISLVNIILNKLAVPEIIQSDLKVENVGKWIKDLMNDQSPIRMKQLKDFKELNQTIGNKGASERAAIHIIEKARLFSNNL